METNLQRDNSFANDADTPHNREVGVAVVRCVLTGEIFLGYWH